MASNKLKYKVFSSCVYRCVSNCFSSWVVIKLLNLSPGGRSVRASVCEGFISLYVAAVHASVASLTRSLRLTAGQAEAELKDFSPYYRKQFSIARFSQVEDDLQQHKEKITQLLKQRVRINVNWWPHVWQTRMEARLDCSLKQKCANPVGGLFKRQKESSLIQVELKHRSSVCTWPINILETQLLFQFPHVWKQYRLLSETWMELRVETDLCSLEKVLGVQRLLHSFALF